MRKVTLILSLILLGMQLSAQKLINYDKNGGKIKSVTEYVDISIINTPGNKSYLGPTSFAGVVLGPVYNIISATIKNGLEKRQKSFTASYSNSSEFSIDDIKKIELKSLLIRRYAINTLDDINNSHLMAEFLLTILPDPNNLSIQLHDILLKHSKARYTKGDNLSLTINIKATSTTQIEKRDSATREVTVESKSKDSEGTIIIPILQVKDSIQDLSGKGKVINKIRLNGISLSNPGSIKFSINITETNISRIDPSKIQTIIANNSNDVQSILKALFGVTNK